MTPRTLCMMALLLASPALALRGSSRRGVPAAKKAEVPSWACDLKAGPAAVKNNMMFASGDATVDMQDSKALEKIAQLRENVTATDEKKLIKEATLETKLAKKESELSADLQKKAKAEETTDKKAYTKDAKASLKALSDAEKAEKKAKKDVEEAKAEAKSTKVAAGEWKEDAKFLKAFAVVEKLQKVQAVDSKALSSLVTKKEKDLLVFFYAPWCPHCQTFVMHDEHGNPEKAPLELFRTELEKNGALKTLSVLKYDTQADQAIPSEFDVQYLPTAYLATADGKIVMYEGNPHDVTALRAFVKTHAPRTKGV